MSELDLADRRGIMDYGLQTLKWSFLLNAGAIALVAAYIGGLGKSGLIFTPLVRPLWPFAVGCVLVTLAGAAGYLNFCYWLATRPSPEALHNFSDPQARTWPARSDLSWKLNASRNAAILFGVASVLFFLYGVYRVLRTALS